MGYVIYIYTVYINGIVFIGDNRGTDTSKNDQISVCTQFLNICHTGTFIIPACN